MHECLCVFARLSTSFITLKNHIYIKTLRRSEDSLVSIKVFIVYTINHFRFLHATESDWTKQMTEMSRQPQLFRVSLQACFEAISGSKS